MAFTPITATQIEVGKPVKKELWDATKDSFDNHESRIALTEAAIQKVIVINEMVINAAQYASSTTLEQVAIFRAAFTFDLLSAVLTNIEAGTSGTLEIDILTGPDLTSLTSVFSTKPSILFSAGNYAESTNAVFSSTTVNANDYVQLNITSLQSPQKRFHIFVVGEV